MHVFWFQIIAWFSSLFGQCYQWHIKVEFFPEIYCSYLIKGFFPLKVICEVNLRSTVTRFSFNNRCKHSVPDFFRFFIQFGREGKYAYIEIYRSGISSNTTLLSVHCLFSALYRSELNSAVGKYWAFWKYILFQFMDSTIFIFWDNMNIIALATM